LNYESRSRAEIVTYIQIQAAVLGLALTVSGVIGAVGHLPQRVWSRTHTVRAQMRQSPVTVRLAGVVAVTSDSSDWVLGLATG
jgi:hypothetical protein